MMEFAVSVCVWMRCGVFGSCSLMQTVASKKGEPGSTSGAGRVCRETNRQMCRRLLAAVQQWLSLEMNPKCCVFVTASAFGANTAAEYLKEK